VGLYARHVLPRLIDLAMRNRVVRAERRRALPGATGRVLEIGVGSGLNLPFYGGGVRALCGVDPSTELWRLGRARAVHVAFPVAFVAGTAERLPVAAAAFDTVVMTWTLCSVADPAAALAEVRRALRPGGRLLFVEHGRAPDAGVAAWQDRLTPWWSRLAGGCHLNRPIDELVRAAGFAGVGIDAGYAAGPRLLTFLFRGTAAAPDR
jgi:ubiquinone/menaquinone biosynthesis C-methylase UbiE